MQSGVAGGCGTAGTGILIMAACEQTGARFANSPPVSPFLSGVMGDFRHDLANRSYTILGARKTWELAFRTA